MTKSDRALRLFAVWTDDPTESRIACDAIVGGADARIIGSWPLFGATDLGSARERPFLVDAAGRFVFGGEDRGWRTDLRQRPIHVGEHFSVWWTRSEVGFYEIVKLAALGSKTRAP